MFNWLPRWHPFVWTAVIIIVVLVWQDPAGSGRTVHGWFGYIPMIADHVSLFFRSL